jgi:hypothetical protein
MNADAAPAMARHIRGHIVRPWRADVFMGIEIIGAAGEINALGAAVRVLRPRKAAVYCPETGCHESLGVWCKLPTCETLNAPRPNILRAHCNQKLRRRPSFEMMSHKKQRCFTHILQQEASGLPRSLAHPHSPTASRYDVVAYMRPDLWYSSPRHRSDLTILLSSIPGILLNGGTCDGVVTKRVGKERCLAANETYKTQRGWCTAASDHSALMHRRWAPDYFSAAELTTHMANNASFGCESSFGAASGVCECTVHRKLGLPPECLLSSWLSHTAVPYSRVPWKTVFAMGMDDEGNAVMDARSGLKYLNGSIPSHCTLVPKGSFKTRGHLEQLFFANRTRGKRPTKAMWAGPHPNSWIDGLPEKAYTLYRPQETLKAFLRCNTSSPVW